MPGTRAVVQRRGAVEPVPTQLRDAQRALAPPARITVHGVPLHVGQCSFVWGEEGMAVSRGGRARGKGGGAQGGSMARDAEKLQSTITTTKNHEEHLTQD